MPEIHIPLGRETCLLTLPESRLAGVLTPRKHECSQSETELIQNALAAPIGCERLRDMARGKARVLVITSDHTRPMPSHVTLPLLLDEIRSQNAACEVRILIATGMHRATTAREICERFGAELAAREQIIVHNANDAAHMVCLGTLPSGGELWLNDLVSWADLIVSEGFIEPHFFAGFSGGRKSILPGIAARQTVLYNHNAAFIASPQATQGSLAQNPIHRDMQFAAERAGLAFILNVLVDADKRVTAAFAGDPIKAHEAGCAACAAAARVPRVTAPIVVTSNGGYPLDQNLYQCVKGLTAAEACVTQGGAIILCAQMADGHGGEAFYRCFAERANAREVMRDIVNVPMNETRPDQWQSQILARVLLKAHCIFVTGRENRDMVQAMHMEWAADLPQALSLAERHVGRGAQVAVIPNGVEVIVE